MNEHNLILLVDDEVKITQVLSAYLEAAGYRTICAYDGKTAAQLLERQQFSLILLDLMLPDISGEELCRMVRQQHRTPVIMLTAKSEERDILEGLRIGADDYITKPFSPRVVVAKAKAVLRRSQNDLLTECPLSYEHGALEIDFQNRIVKCHGVPIHLTRTEQQLLFTLAKSPRRAFTRDQLISFALQDNFDGYDRSIDTHIKSIRSKIEPDRRNPILIKTIHGIGYQFAGREDSGAR